MIRLCARAPGKLFLLGEYAVLDGAPAIVAAVDRFVQVELSVSDDATVSIDSDQTDATASFDAGNPSASDPFYDVALSTYRTCLDAHPGLARHGLRIRINSASSYAEQTKIGFGSSAAVTVALVAALAAVVPGSVTLDRDHVFALALDAHRRMQRGAGSGADVAASTYGALLLFRPRSGSLPQVVRLPIPEDLRVLAAWTGKPAASVGLIADYLALRNGNTAARRGFVEATTLAVEHFAAAAQRGKVSFDAIAANGRALETLTSETQLSILTPALRELIALSRGHGGVAKVSGAGGGDCGIAFVKDRAAIAGLYADWRAAGLTPLDIVVNPQGVSVERV